MTYIVEHLYVDSSGDSSIVTHDGTKHAQYNAVGDLPIRHPGRLNVFVQAKYYIQMKADEPPDAHTHVPAPKPIPHGIPLSTIIFTPDGREFNGTHVTRADLEQFRDLREVSQGNWRYVTSGVSEAIPISDEDGWVKSGAATVRIAIEETITSQSAGLLVSSSGGNALKHIYSFDLFRVGQFIANVSLVNGTISQSAKLRLMDPDGTVVASGSHGALSSPVSLRSLNKSRDASGKVRPWTLEFVTTDPTTWPERSEE